MFGQFEKGNKCFLRINGKRIPAELLDVRDRVIRMRCDEDGFAVQGRGIVLEFEHEAGTAAYFTRFFKKYTGMAPENFRQEYQNDLVVG